MDQAKRTQVITFLVRYCMMKFDELNAMSDEALTKLVKEFDHGVARALGVR